MEKSTYTLAGWLAIAAAVLALPLLFLAIVVDVGARRGTEMLPALLTLYAGLTVAQTGMHLYAFYRLRHLLNERFGFHAVDTLIVAMIVLMLAMVSVSLLGRIGLATGLIPEAVTPLLVGMIVVFGVPMAVLSIVFAVKLLALQDDLFGLLRPYVYTGIAAGVCFATLVLAPLGMIVAAVSTAILGFIFLRADRAPGVDFV
jgi:hypothetical protein